MITIPLPLQNVIFLFLFGIFLCFLFEASGLPEGFRRQGKRNYLSLICGLVVVVVTIWIAQAQVTPIVKGGLVFDRIAKSAILSLSIVVFCVIGLFIDRLKPLNSDRGELYAFLLFSHLSAIVLCAAQDLSLLLTAIIACLLGQIGTMALRKKRRSGSEAVLKMILLLAFCLAFAAVILFLHDASDQSLENAPSRIGAKLLLCAFLFLLMGAFPLQTLQVDLLEGAPSYVSSFLSATLLIACTSALLRICSALAKTDFSGRTFLIFTVFAGLSLCISPIMAFDQRRIARLLAYLLVSQAGLVLLFASLTLREVFFKDSFLALFFTHLALCSAGIFAGLNYWKDAKHSFRNWEDFAGAGRKHPIAAGAFLIVIASVGGAPFTSGFLIRQILIESSLPKDRVMIAAILLGALFLSIVPVLRLSAFFFGKAIRHDFRKLQKPRQMVVLLFCAMSTFLLSLAPQSLLDILFRY